MLKGTRSDLESVKVKVTKSDEGSAFIHIFDSYGRALIQLISYYHCIARTLKPKWYRALFAQALDTCVNNAWLPYRSHSQDAKQTLTLKKETS